MLPLTPNQLTKKAQDLEITTRSIDRRARDDMNMIEKINEENSLPQPAPRGPADDNPLKGTAHGDPLAKASRLSLEGFPQIPAYEGIQSRDYLEGSNKQMRTSKSEFGSLNLDDLQQKLQVQMPPDLEGELAQITAMQEESSHAREGPPAI